MNKIIIVGHHSSGLEEVESLLLRRGMKPAQPSRREGLLPTELTASLCQAHQTPTASTLTSESEFQPIEAAEMWHAMALDLAMGNSDQALWGWADSETIHLLDYWRKLDSQAAFILVYDDPGQMLAESLIPEAEPLDEAGIQQRVDNWAAYNGAMLRFFLRHPDRCLLVHSRQATGSPDAWIEQLQTHLGIQLPPVDPSETPPAAAMPASHLTGALQHALALTGRQTGTLPDGRVAERFIIDNYLGGQPARAQLYEELQAAASLPLETVDDVSVSSRTAWTVMAAERQLLGGALHQLNDQLVNLRKRDKHATARQELMNLQLHQAQEELERYFLENLRLKQEAADARAVKPAPPAKPPLRGAAARVKQQLSYRLGATMIERSHSLGGWLFMPFSLIGEARRFRKQQQKRSKEKLPPIHEYDDAHKAEQIKQQLSYRLGNAIVRNTRSPLGLVRLPFALAHETIDFRRTRRQSKG